MYRRRPAPGRDLVEIGIERKRQDAGEPGGVPVALQHFFRVGQEAPECLGRHLGQGREDADLEFDQPSPLREADGRETRRRRKVARRDGEMSVVLHGYPLLGVWFCSGIMPALEILLLKPTTGA